MSHKYKIMLLSAIDSEQPNASIIHLCSIAKAFANAGHFVDLVLPKTRGKKVAFNLEDPRINTHLKLSAKSLGLPNSVSNLLYLPWLLLYLSTHKVDIIYSRLNSFSFFGFIFIRLFTKIKIVSEHNGWMEDEGRVLYHPKLLVKLERIFQIWDARLAHFVRVVVPGLKDLLITNGIDARKIFVVGNGTDTNRLYPISRESALKESGLNPTFHYVGFIGNLAYWQGVELAIKAFQKIVTAVPKVKLLIAGEGPEKKNLEQLAIKLKITEHVHFLGSVPIANANQIINTFDIAIAPFTAQRNSKIGLSPLKIKDYAAAGRPIIAADVKGIKEVASHKWLTPHKVDDANDLASKIISLIEQPEKRRKMAKAAREYAQEHYDWSLIAKKIIDQIENQKS